MDNQILKELKKINEKLDSLLFKFSLSNVSGREKMILEITRERGSLSVTEAIETFQLSRTWILALFRKIHKKHKHFSFSKGSNYHEPSVLLYHSDEIFNDFIVKCKYLLNNKTPVFLIGLMRETGLNLSEVKGFLFKAQKEIPNLIIHDNYCEIAEKKPKKINRKKHTHTHTLI